MTWLRLVRGGRALGATRTLHLSLDFEATVDPPHLTLEQAWLCDRRYAEPEETPSDEIRRRFARFMHRRLLDATQAKLSRTKPPPPSGR